MPQPRKYAQAYCTRCHEPMKQTQSAMPICRACRNADYSVKGKQLIKIFQERYPNKLPFEVPEALGEWMDIVHANSNSRALPKKKETSVHHHT
jgi:hypothetical protein